MEHTAWGTLQQGTVWGGKCVPWVQEEEPQEEVEYGDATTVLGAFNMDWDQAYAWHAHPWHARAWLHRHAPAPNTRWAKVFMSWQVDSTDILAVLQSFVPAGGAIESVEVYTTIEGAKTIEKEKTQGPQVWWTAAHAAHAAGSTGAA